MRVKIPKELLKLGSIPLEVLGGLVNKLTPDLSLFSAQQIDNDPDNVIKQLKVFEKQCKDHNKPNIFC